MSSILFENVNVLTCSGEAPFLGEVLIEDNRIVAVERHSERIARPAEQRIDGAGLTLMPGLI